jgi:hypothetical protein
VERVVERELVTRGILRRVPIVITSTYAYLIIKREILSSRERKNTIQNGSIITFNSLLLSSINTGPGARAD